MKNNGTNIEFELSANTNTKLGVIEDSAKNGKGVSFYVTTKGGSIIDLIDDDSFLFIDNEQLPLLISYLKTVNKKINHYKSKLI